MNAWYMLRARLEFDPDYYSLSYPDLSKSRRLWRHYLRHGWFEGRDPSAEFSTDYYLAENPDVRDCGVNPFVHYVSKGRAEGRIGKPPPNWRVSTSSAVPAAYAERHGSIEDPIARVIALYLPQFHEIPENNLWWGQGFTEWTNVRAAEPQFSGHYQPHVPGDLGYYDLTDRSVLESQVKLAKSYGVSGFCFYFYWFQEKRLLEKPLETWLKNPDLDLPFCLCWANENWTRRWDGREHEVLMSQRHSPEDDLLFIKEVAPYLSDSRYIRVDSKPLLIVYRPSLLPSMKETAQRWRDWCRSNGIGEIYLAYTQSFEAVDPERFGLDAAIEFPPNDTDAREITESVTPLKSDFDMNIFDWNSVADRWRQYRDVGYTLFRSVCPSWDNTPRRKGRGTAFINSAPELYKKWLRRAIDDTWRRCSEPSKRLVFVNAWNEWGEGAHLEPDEKYGYAWLQATREALEEARADLKFHPHIVIVSHDAHPHGAQYQVLHMARTLRAMHLSTEIITLGQGPLFEEFCKTAPTRHIDLQHSTETAILDVLRRIPSRGARIALVNTTVSGALVPLLKRADFQIITLVHELPGILRDYRLAEQAAAIAQQSDVVVFPADIVRLGFEQFVGSPVDRALIRPQGLLRQNPYKGRREEARAAVCERHRIPLNSRIVLAVGYADHRKGADLFLLAADKARQLREDVVFVWVGKIAHDMEQRLGEEIKKRGLESHARFVGFVSNPFEYYVAASVFALTSREDPFPNVVMEAADVGAPVVAFEGATGAADFITDRGGLLAEAFDPEDFARKTCDLLADPQSQSPKPVGSLSRYLLDLLHQTIEFPRVSVVVPNYNYARYLRARLSSVMSQRFPVYELIVLDDASADDSLSVINAVRDEHREREVSVIENERNSGSVFRQWRAGINRCSGDLVWIAEADDLADPSFLSFMVPMIVNSEADIAYCQSRQIDESGEQLAPDYLDYTRDVSDAWTSGYSRDGLEEITSALAIKNTIPNVSAVLFRREALNKALDALGEELFSYKVAGDWLVYLEMARSGRVSYTPVVLNSHRRHAGSSVSSEAAATHLREVERVQERAAGVVQLSDEALEKAARWRDHVRAYLGLDTQ